MIAIAEGVQVALVTGGFSVIVALLGAAMHLNKRDHDRNADLARKGFEKLSAQLADTRSDVQDTRADVREIKADIRDDLRPRVARLEEKETP